MFLDHIERFVASVGPAQRSEPEVAAALAAIQSDRAARDRVLTFARDADEAQVQSRLLALSRQLGWLTPQEERAEFVRMIADRMARGTLGKHEVDLVCASSRSRDASVLPQLLAADAVRPTQVTHAAVLACLGSSDGHARTLRALTSVNASEVEIAQVYLRHRPLADADEVRTVTSNIARMSAVDAQVRALETLAKQRLADAQSLHEIAGLFPRTRSLQVQRAIANILIRADTKLLARSEIARSLRQYRLKSPDGQDVIDVLIQLLQQST